MEVSITDSSSEDSPFAQLPEVVAGGRSRWEKEIIRERLQDIIGSISYDTLILLKEGI